MYKISQFSFGLLALTAAIFFSAQSVMAQSPCGNIITYYEIDEDGDGINDSELQPIDNCDTPFGVATGNPDLIISFGETELAEGGVYEWVGVTEQFTIQNTIPEANMSGLVLYRHQGPDYVALYPEPNEPYTFTESGIYTAVMYEDQLILSQGWVHKILTSIIPTAHAFPGPSKIVTFEVTEIPVSIGASSILFLPGIQASRLYQDGLLGTEDQLWEPNYNQDVYQLRMNESGDSVENVYTRDILDEVFGIKNVYKGFADFLTGLQSDSVIADWRPFAYDWRYSVVDVAEEGTQYETGIRDAVSFIETLAENSFSGKVTLIGHSNGGLLAKALMIRLEREGKVNLVDKVIFIGTPQLGTPKAIASLLHGYDQQSLLGLVMNANTIRETTRNMSGAFGLMPTRAYFDGGAQPPVRFDASQGTEFFRSAYGDTIDSEEELRSFMAGEGDGRTDMPETLHEAITVNGSLLARAFEEHNDMLDGWIAPEEVEVVEIVGVGLSTLRGIEYREFTERECTTDTSTVGGEHTCTERKIYKPYPLFTQYGDETVVAQSAEAYLGEKKTLFLDLDAISDLEPNELVAHADITENSFVQELLREIIEKVEPTARFFSAQKPNFDEENVLVGIHSPASLSVADSFGNKVEKGEERYPIEEIKESRYFELGDSAYALVPRNGEYDILLKGTGYGGVTFTVDEILGENQSSLAHVFVATITPSTTVEVVYENDKLGNLLIDENGDGVIDVEMTKDGVVVTKITTYENLKQAIRGLVLATPLKKSLLLLAGIAEELDKKSAQNVKWHQFELLTLNQLEATVKLYVKKKLLTQSDANNIFEIITKLKI